MFFTILIWILVLVLLVVIHELWHFTAAKKLWVKVLEFWVWIPPKVKTMFKDKSWTDYTLNAIPLWWFVRLKGEDPEDLDDFLAKDSIQKAKFWKKTIIIFAGIVANLITAWLLFSIVFMSWVEPIRVLPDNAYDEAVESYLFPSESWAYEQWLLSWEIVVSPYVVNEVLEEWLAYEAWISSGDTILAINQVDVDSNTLWEVLKNNIGKDVEIKYLSNNEEVFATITCPEDNCLLGVAYYNTNNIETLPVNMWFWEAMGAGWKEIWVQTKLTFSSLASIGKWLVSFDSEETWETLQQLTWPVGAIKIWESVFQSGGFAAILAFIWMISLALAIFNLIPIPALDWGRFVGFSIQAIFGIKPENYARVEWYVNFVFFWLLMWLWIYIMIKDLSFWGVNVF